MHNKANLPTQGCGEEKCNIYYRVSTQSPHSWCLKDPDSPRWLSGKGFQRLGEGGVVWCGISSWTFFLLFSGEVIMSQHHQPSGFNWTGVYMLEGSMLTF